MRKEKKKEKEEIERIDQIRQRYAKTIKEMENRARRADLIDNNEKLVVVLRRVREVRFLRENMLKTTEEITDFLQGIIDKGGHTPKTLEKLEYLRDNVHRSGRWWWVSSSKRILMGKFLTSGLQSYLRQRFGIKAKGKILSYDISQRNPKMRGMNIVIGKMVKI